MRPVHAPALILALSFLVFSAWAGPANPKHVAPDAKWYIHLDLDNARETAIFKELLDAVRLQFPLDETLAQLKQAIGVNPLTDITGVTVYNTSFEKDAAAVIFYAKVEQALLTAALANNPDYKQQAYGKHTFHTWTDPNDGKTKNGCFWGEGVVVMGDRVETLQAAIDVLDGKAKSGSSLIKEHKKSEFLYAAADLAQSDDKNVSQLLSNSEAATASASEEQGTFALTLNLTAKTAEQANQLKTILDGLKAFGQLGAAKETPTAAGLIKQVSVSVEGARVTARFQHDSKTLLQALQKLHQENQAKRSRIAPPDAAPKGL